MIFNRFAIQLLVRFVLVLANFVALAYLIGNTSLVSPAIILILLAILQLWLIFRFISRTNTELARFLSAVKYQDFVQNFAPEYMGTGFPELNQAFRSLIDGFRRARSDREQQARYLQTLLEHVPVAVLAVREGDQVELLNTAARRLFNRPRKTSFADLETFGPLFLQHLKKARAGEKRLTRVLVDGNEEHMIMSTTQITVGGDVQRIVALQDVQSELDAKEIAAWQDLVRVVSHEILNSVTPIASLARTASELVDDASADTEDERLQDIRDAISTLARRSEGLTHFVQSYRKLTTLAPPKKSRVTLSEYLARLHRLMQAEFKGRGIALELNIDTAAVQIDADPELLDQALINLVRNASDAVADVPNPQITIAGGLNERGRAVVEVGDNGPGIAEDAADRIFLPFFSTKPQGSGIGLALTRQIVMAHGGSIAAGTSAAGGASFRITL